MNITLGKEFEKRITEKVSDGLYTPASEVIRDGLILLFEKDVAKKKQLEILQEEVTKGFEQLAAGESSKHSVLHLSLESSFGYRPLEKRCVIKLLHTW
jgi:antitoxin ParD1/3/4